MSLMLSTFDVAARRSRLKYEGTTNYKRKQENYSRHRRDLYANDPSYKEKVLSKKLTRRRTVAGKTAQYLTDMERKTSLEGYFWKKVRRLKETAVRRDIKFDLTACHLKDLYILQKGFCALTRRKLILRKIHQDSLSVDRIKPKLGYVKGNLRLITYQANCARWNWSDDQLLELCKAIIKGPLGRRK